MQGDIVHNYQQEQGEEENVQNIRDIEDTRTTGRHYRIVPEWPIDIPNQAVKVGEFESDTVIHVNASRDEYRGPGAFINNRLYKMKFYNARVYDQVASAAWKENGEWIVDKVANLPDGVEPDKEGLKPHQFSGRDTW